MLYKMCLKLLLKLVDTLKHYILLIINEIINLKYITLLFDIHCLLFESFSQINLKDQFLITKSNKISTTYCFSTVYLYMFMFKYK